LLFIVLSNVFAGVQTCGSNGSSTPATCFTFSLPESVAADNLIESATLWLHKRTFPVAVGRGEKQINLWAANSSQEQLQMIASVWSKLKGQFTSELFLETNILTK
jgi:hypothetical protein